MHIINRYNNDELISYIYSNNELFNEISEFWNIDHIEVHIDDIRDYINQDEEPKKYVVSIEFFDGTHQDINQFDTFEEGEKFIDNYERIHENECYLHLILDDDSVYTVCFEESINDIN